MGNPQGKSFYRRPLPVTLSDLQSPEGRALFQAALSQGEAEAFFPLISHLQTQSHPALCGLTTLSTILNALSIDPLRVWAHPWRWYAENLLDCCVPLQEVMEKGITVDELACTAVCEGVDVTVHRGFDISQARKLIRRSVRNPTDGTFQFLAVSFHRARLGQTGTGHFSPIAAYESESDSVLILDVARFKVSFHYYVIYTACNFVLLFLHCLLLLYVLH